MAKKIDFTKIEGFQSFEDEKSGVKRAINIARDIGNLMKYDGALLMDIDFEKLAEKIYYSTGPVEVPDHFIAPIKDLARNSGLKVWIKRTLINNYLKFE